MPPPPRRGGGTRPRRLRVAGRGENPLSGLEALAAWIVGQGHMPFLCHPYWSGLRVEDMLAAPSLAGLEIWNGGSEVLAGNGLSTVHWDDALQHGRLLTGIATDDCHTPGQDSGFGWTWVLAEERSGTAVVEALRRGHAYGSGARCCSTSRSRRNRSACVVRRPDPYGCAPGLGTAAASTPTRRWAVGVGRPANGTPPGSSPRPVFDYPEFWRWARVEVEDERGRRAWSNPFLLDGEPPAPILRRRHASGLRCRHRLRRRRVRRRRFPGVILPFQTVTSQRGEAS